MAKRNYSFERRQRELAKKKKKEEKLKEKAERKAGTHPAAEGADAGEGEADEVAPTAAGTGTAES